jgi:hypothetical protein
MFDFYILGVVIFMVFSLAVSSHQFIDGDIDLKVFARQVLLYPLTSWIGLIVVLVLIIILIRDENIR